MNTLLYNKYRPLLFREVAGNGGITGILSSLIKSRGFRNTHYIFYGSAGTGKTTLARILARAINCEGSVDGEPCNVCGHCKRFLEGSYADYIEIDGTTYNKVEDAKRLIELASQYPIVGGYYRVIMIDEAHALSNQAFDKFLALLESYDVNTIFIFSTTDIHLFRPAIISRCFSFSVRPLSSREIAIEVVRICELEGIDYSVDAVNQLSYYYSGRPRDALKTLDLYIRASGNFLCFSERSQESLMLEIFKLAYYNKVDDYLCLVDRLDNGSVFQVLSRMLNEIFLYPKIPLVLLSQSEVEDFKLIFNDQDIKSILSDILKYKIDNLYSLKLFLVQIMKMGDVVQVFGVSQTARRFVSNNKNVLSDGSGSASIGKNKVLCDKNLSCSNRDSVAVSDQDLLSNGFSLL